MTSIGTELRVASGHVTVIRLFDLAYACDLGRIEEVLREAGAARIRLSRVPPKAVDFGEPPVAFTLGNREIDGVGGPPGVLHVRIYAFGAVSLSLRFPVVEVAWPSFVEFVARVDDTLTDHGLWAAEMDRVRAMVGSAVEQPNPTDLVEDFLLATVQQFDRPLTGDTIRSDLDLVPLLAGEARPLAASARAELLRQTFQYYDDDLVALAWDRAFIVEPTGDTDVADVLELANAQLLEMRYYDERLDAELPSMYERVEQARSGFGVLSRRRYANLARELYALVAVVTESAERVENALVVTEDVYLARVYRAAIDTFRVHSLQGAVERKLAIIRDTYSAMYEEAATARAEYLEAAIVLLIVVEIVLAFFVW